MRKCLVKKRLPEFQEEAKAPCGALVAVLGEMNPLGNFTSTLG